MSGDSTNVDLKVSLPGDSISLPVYDGENGPTPNESSDQRLLTAILTRDSSHAAIIYRTLRPVIDRAICRVLGHRESDHEDLVQMAFEQTLRSIIRRKFSGDCSLATWVSVIASRIALSELRRRYRFRGAFDLSDGEVGGSVAEEKSTEAKLEARSDLRFVRRALAGIQPTRAETIVLHDLEGLSLKQVAETLKISETAAHSRLTRGRKQLRSILVAEGKR